MKKNVKLLALVLALLMLLASCGESKPQTINIEMENEDVESAAGELLTESESEPASESESESEPASESETEPTSESETEPETETEPTSESVTETEKESASETEKESASESEKEPASESEKESASEAPVQETPAAGQLALNLKARSLDTSKPMVALTFDDGPSKYTSRILDKLESVGGRGTFCVVGERLNTFSDTLTRMVNDGHQIVSHTWEHTNLKKNDKATGIKAITSVQTYMKDNYGYDMTFFRPPYGAVNSTVKEESNEVGLGILYWSVDTLDWSTRNASKTLAAVKKDTEDGSIILFHDIYEPTADAIDNVVPYLADQGYQLVTVDELLYYKRGGANTGKIYYNG